MGARARRGRSRCRPRGSTRSRGRERPLPWVSAAPSVATGPTGPTPAMDGATLPGFTLCGQVSHRVRNDPCGTSRPDDRPGKAGEGQAPCGSCRIGWPWSRAGLAAIGRALARRFAADGMRRCWPTSSRLRWRPRWRSSRPRAPTWWACPPTWPVAADVDAVRDQALAAFGAVHVVCNNAGVGGGGIVDAPLALWEWTISVNLMGVRARRAHVPAPAARAGRGPHRQHRVARRSRWRGGAGRLLHDEVRASSD